MTYDYVVLASPVGSDLCEIAETVHRSPFLLTTVASQPPGARDSGPPPAPRTSADLRGLGVARTFTDSVDFVTPPHYGLRLQVRLSPNTVRIDFSPFRICSSDAQNRRGPSPELGK
eukprot:2043380-Prymnesium_polylepis.2